MTFLAVFDFDQTLLEQNSDVEIQKLAPNNGQIPQEIRQIARNEGWTAFVNACLDYLHANDISPDAIIKFIRGMEYVNGAVHLIKTLKNDMKADIIIISDANSVYIEESLDEQGIRDAFSEIFTNPANFTEDGKLVVTPFSNQNFCDLSERNLCKGQVLKDYIKEKKFDFVTYAGDGGNDFCPIEKLSANDLAFVRKGYHLEKTIPAMKEKKGLEIKATIHTWSDCHEILNKIKEKIDKNAV